MIYALFAIALGTAVLVGWLFDLPLLKSLLPGLVTMKPNTALAFVLAGGSLLLLSPSPVSGARVRAGRALALVVALIGGLTLCEFIFGWRLGIDELLFRDDPAAAATLIPGRMAPHTAVNFLLLGLALLGFEWEPRPAFRPAEILALLAGIVSLISIVEYALGQPILYDFSQYTRMALHTAAIFLALSAGVLLARPGQGVVGALRSGGISRLEQAIYSALVLAFLAVSAGGAWFYRAQEQQVRREVESGLEAIARLKADQITQWRAERLGDAAVLMDSAFFSDGVKRWMAAPQAELAEKILGRFRSMQEYYRYHDLLLVDTHGQVRLGLAGRASASHPEELEFLATALREQQPMLSDLHAGPPELTPHLNLITPIVQKTGARRQSIGGVVLTIEARQFLYPLIQSWPTASLSAETLLVRLDGDHVLFLNDLRHRPDTTLSLRIPLSRQEVPAVMAVLGREGVFHGEDYRGVKVLSVLRAIPDSPWFMVTKIDEAEALAEWRFRAGLIVVVIAALALALAIAGLMVWKQKNKNRALLRFTEALREKTAQLQLQSAALDAAANAIFITNRDATIIWVNHAFSALSGYSAEEAVGRNPRFLKSGVQDIEFYRGMYQTILAGSVWQGELVNRYKDGRLGAEEMTIAPVRGDDGKITHFIAIKQDITERKRLERQEHDRSRVMESISTGAPLPAILELVVRSVEHNDTDALCSILLLDDAGEHLLLGAAPSLPEFYNQAIHGLAIGDGVGSCGTAAATRQRVIAADVQTHPYWVGYRELAQKANLRSCWSEPILSASDSVLGTFAIYYREPREPEGKDIERIQFAASLACMAIERKRAEAKILKLNAELEQRVAERTAQLQVANTALQTEIAERKQAQEELDRYFSLARDLFCILGFDGYFKRLNPAWEKVLGWPSAELLARPFLDFVHAEDREATVAAAARLTEGLQIGSFENRYLCKDGSYKWLLWSSTPEVAEQLIFGVAYDITERKRVEEKLRAQSEEILRKNAELEQANRAKSDFLANMSHELRTPLNAIIGFSEMLKDGVLGDLEAKQKEFIGDIFGAGTHLLSLINDILDLSKVEAGMLQLEAAAVDVAALLKASTLIVREKALAHRIRLDTDLDPALGTMLADERKLKQMVYNLLSNAVKFTPEGGTVRLRARLCPRAEVAFDEAMPARLIALPPGEDNEFLAITVEDNGVGIAEQDLPKLFEAFTQVDSSASRRHAGTGLGLSLVRRLAELHDGTVGVASRPGAGSRFCVWLPYRAAAAAVQVGKTVPEVTAPSGPAVPLALVIEDDDRTAELIAAQLRVEGFQVMRAATAEEGLVRAAKRRPQIITLDIFLPEMDGWEFMRRLNADPKLANTPVVIISVSADLEHGLALGARRVLQKPFAPEELMAALAGLVDARPGDERARVLVVDDNVQAVELVATVLQAEGYHVTRAYGGDEAIEAARSNRPDLVILDLMMSEVSGFEVAKTLRASEQTARIPILVLTAKDLSAEERARLNDTVGVVMAKTGFSTSDLLVEVRRALPKRGGD